MPYFSKESLKIKLAAKGINAEDNFYADAIRLIETESPVRNPSGSPNWGRVSWAAGAGFAPDLQ